jgi:hypothetical protein
VIAFQPTMLTVGRGAPGVKLLDALAAGLDERGLRAWSTAEAARVGAPYTSRSYRYPYALMAWHTEPVGVDIERIEPFDRALIESIATPAERRLFTDDFYPDALLASLWSSKEALAKGLGDAVRYDPRRLDSPVLWPDGRAGPWRAVLLPLPAGHTGWLCWRATLQGTVSESARRNAMKEGLPGGKLRLSPKGELEEARLRVARRIGSESQAP